MNFFDFLKLRQMTDPQSVVRQGEMIAPIGLLDPMSVVREGEILSAMPQTMGASTVSIDPMSVVREGEMPSFNLPVAGGLLNQIDPNTALSRQAEIMEMLRRVYFGR